MAENPSDLFKDLDSITKRFLANAREKINESQEVSKVKAPATSLPDSLSALKERLRARKPFGIDVNGIPDNFETRLGRIKQAMSAPADEKEIAENNVIEQNAKKQQESINDFSASIAEATRIMASQETASEEPSSQHPVSKDPPSAPSKQTPQQPAPQDITKSMAVLLGQMTGKGCEKPEYSWTDMDRFSAQLRKCWAGLLTSGDIKKAQSLLPSWSTLIENVYEGSSGWGDHATSWKTWAQNCRKECEILQMWLNPTQVSNLSVPEDFKNKGQIPSSPKTGVPTNLVSSLQHCADFAMFISQSPKTFFWKNTPQSHAFAQSQRELEEWVPQGEKALQWKEDALDCYTVLNAKLVLLATHPAPSSPAPSSPKASASSKKSRK